MALVVPSLATYHAQQTAAPPFAVTIVLPQKLIAGHPATLAVLDSDGKLLPGATIDVGAPAELSTQQRETQRVTTDAAGRAVFTAFAEDSIVIAKALAVSAVTLADPATGSGPARELVVAPVVSQRDRFSICGGEFHGDAASDRVQINGDPALVLAASPACLVVLPGANAKSGPANITVESGAARWSAITTLVALTFDVPNPPLAPPEKSRLTVHVQGSDRPLAVVVENTTPGVLRFLRGDVQQLRTSGGVSNIASVQVQTLRSGDFSFQARLAQAPDFAAAQRYLAAAAQLSPKDSRRKIESLSERLAHSPNEAATVKRELNRILNIARQGDLRTLLEAARAAL